MSEWSTVTFKDVAEFNPRESLKRGEFSIKVGMDKLQPFCRDIPEVEYEEFTGGTKFRNYDTIMARITPCLENGKTAMVNVLDEGQVGFGSTEYIVLRAKKGLLDPYYLYYLVCSPLVRDPAIKSMVGSSGRQRVQTDVIQNLELTVPPLQEQQKIGDVLKKIDDKILANNRINRNLLEQAQAYFSNCYANATIQETFTDHIKVLGGGTPNTRNDSFWDGSIPFFTPKDVGEPYTFTTEKTITEDGLRHCNSRLYPVNTTFVTARGTVGKVSLAGVPMAMNQSCYALASDYFPALMVYFYAIETVGSLKHKASGAVFDAIVTRDFEAEKIKILNSSEQNKLLDFVNPIFEQIHGNTIENQRLALLRDFLLPKLMSGELDVSEIDL